MLENNRPNLPYLVWLGLVTLALEIELLLNTGTPEQMVTPARVHLKAQIPEQLAQFLETDARVTSTAKDSPKDLVLAHCLILP